jgi:hypothetical protein
MKKKKEENEKELLRQRLRREWSDELQCFYENDEKRKQDLVSLMMTHPEDYPPREELRIVGKDGWVYMTQDEEDEERRRSREYFDRWEPIMRAKYCPNDMNADGKSIHQLQLDIMHMNYYDKWCEDWYDNHITINMSPKDKEEYFFMKKQDELRRRYNSDETKLDYRTTEFLKYKSLGWLQQYWYDVKEDMRNMWHNPYVRLTLKTCYVLLQGLGFVGKEIVKWLYDYVKKDMMKDLWCVIKGLYRGMNKVMTRDVWLGIKSVYSYVKTDMTKDIWKFITGAIK